MLMVNARTALGSMETYIKNLLGNVAEGNDACATLEGNLDLEKYVNLSLMVKYSTLEKDNSNLKGTCAMLESNLDQEKNVNLSLMANFAQRDSSTLKGQEKNINTSLAQEKNANPMLMAKCRTFQTVKTGLREYIAELEEKLTKAENDNNNMKNESQSCQEDTQAVPWQVHDGDLPY
jgi:chromosome segregation ATPase